MAYWRSTAFEGLLAVVALVTAFSVQSCASGHVVTEQPAAAATHSADPPESTTASDVADGIDPLEDVEPTNASESTTAANVDDSNHADDSVVEEVRKLECPGPCFYAILVSVDEDDWHLVRVKVPRKSGAPIPALVHRYAGYGATDPPAGTRIEFTCTYRYKDPQGMQHYGDCYQGSPQERVNYQPDEFVGVGDFPMDTL